MNGDESTTAMNAHLALRVADVAHIDSARRAIVRCAGALTQEEAHLGRLTLIAQEMARNIAHHAGEGELLYLQTQQALQIVALDRGRGMRDVARCLADNYSTAGTLGAGLGGIRRLADHFDIYSQPGSGTAVFAQIDLRPPRGGGLQIGSVCTALAGEQVCGDAWAAEGNRFLVADGLGHGHFAHQASSAARAIFLQQDGIQPLPELLEQLHRGLTPTRGAAAAVAEIDAQLGEVRFCGVGNIAAMLIDGGTRSMVSCNGTLGYRIGRARAFSYPWTAKTLLIMASDGVSSKFDMNAYPGLTARHAAVIAAVLHRDFKRLNDDATVVVVKGGGEA